MNFDQLFTSLPESGVVPLRKNPSYGDIHSNLGHSGEVFVALLRRKGEAPWKC
jgi:hypothetical protein